MQGLTQIMQDVIGDVDYIVDGFQAQGTEEMLQPLGRGPHLDTGKHNSRIARAIGSLVYDHLEGRASCFHLDSGLHRQAQGPTQKGFQVPCNSQMGGSICAVRRQANF